jgi:hypothetical protein
MLDLRSPPPRAPYNELDRRVHTVRQELSWVAMFIGAIWAVFLLDRFLPLERFGLVPRQWSGLIGVVAMTFLHANWSHLLSNTVPLFILLTLPAASAKASASSTPCTSPPRSSSTTTNAGCITTTTSGWKNSPPTNPPPLPPQPHRRGQRRRPHETPDHGPRSRRRRHRRPPRLRPLGTDLLRRIRRPPPQAHAAALG